jgi:hypothetical protein
MVCVCGDGIENAKDSPYAFYVNGLIRDSFNTTNIPLHITAAGFMKINDYKTPSF